MAEGLLRHRYAELGLPARVRSAGLLRDGQEASPYGVDAMSRRGIDIGTHLSRRLTADLVRDADLILGMERKHIREAVVLVPEALPHSFTLPELARAAAELGPRPPEQTPQQWLARASVGREPRDLLRNKREDEVDDPYGSGPNDYERTAQEIEGLIDTIVTNLYPVSVCSS